MKTTNFNMDLMIPNQANKDVIFNESLLTMDNFLKISINGFSDIALHNLANNEKYILTNGKYKDHICYKTHKSKEIQYLTPQEGMMFFLIETQNFILYGQNGWEEIQRNSILPIIDSKFTGIDGLFESCGSKPYHYLYLNSKTTLCFNKVKIAEITIILKQCHNEIYDLIWPDNILWENKTPHIMTPIANATDIIKLYRLPETKHFLAKIIAQNFQF